MKLRHVLLALLGGTSAAAHADNIDINLNNDALRLSYAHQLQSTKGLSVEVGGLYTEEMRYDGHRVDDDELLLHAGLLVSGENWSQAGTFDISIGGRLIAGSIEPGNTNYDLVALGFGGDVRFSPVHRLGIGGNIYYAPDITSFQDANSYQEFGVRVDYQLMPQAFVYVGYRNVEVELDNPGSTKAEFDDNVHLGFKMTF